MVAACLGTPALLNEKNMSGVKEAVLNTAGNITRGLGGVPGRPESRGGTGPDYTD